MIQVKKSLFIFLFLTFILVSCKSQKEISLGLANITGIDIIFTGSETADSVFVTVSPIPSYTTIYWKEYVESIYKGRKMAFQVKDRHVHIPADTLPSVYRILCDLYSFPDVYLRPDENVTMEIKSMSPADCKISGTPVYSEIPHSKEFHSLRSKLFKVSRYKLTDTEFDSISAEMRGVLRNIMCEADPEQASRAVAMLEEDFASFAFSIMPPEARTTLYYTAACAINNSARRSEKQRETLNAAIAGTSPAPDISLPGTDGKIFDVASLRGKWVVIDFWVSWCAPCKKGFMKMKDIYARYREKLEVVAVDCGDHEDIWKELVTDLELPWINLLAPSPESQGGAVSGYHISAYPTKIIIDPGGHIREFIVGENDYFYNKLESFLNN